MTVKPTSAAHVGGLQAEEPRFGPTKVSLPDLRASEHLIWLQNRVTPRLALVNGKDKKEICGFLVLSC